MTLQGAGLTLLIKLSKQPGTIKMRTTQITSPSRRQVLHHHTTYMNRSPLLQTLEPSVMSISSFRMSKSRNHRKTAAALDYIKILTRLRQASVNHCLSLQIVVMPSTMVHNALRIFPPILDTTASVKDFTTMLPREMPCDRL